MLKIAICDDDKVICQQLENIIKQYESSSKIILNVEVFYSGTSLYQTMALGHNFDLIFLDIEMELLSGIDVGAKIRRQLNNQVLQIVYISGQENYALALFSTHPLDFLIKPLKPRQVIESIELTASLLHELRGYFTYKIGGEVRRMPVKDIIYFESANRKINMFTSQGGSAFYGRLDEIYEDLKNYRFLYIHKSYLVNYYFVELFKYDAVVLTDGLDLPISQTRRKMIRSECLKFGYKG